MPTINNQPITRGDIRIFEQGDWLADVATNSGERIPDGTRVSLVAGTLTLSGAIVRGGITEAVGRYQVVGRPEWSTPMPARPRNAYQSADSVLLKTVLSDIAKDTLGSNWANLVVMPPAADLGRHYERTASFGTVQEAAHESLKRLGVPWYVRNDGVTVFGVRPSGTVSTEERVLVEYRNDAIGYRVVNCEDTAAFAPGLTFENEVIGEVTYALSADDIKMHVWPRSISNTSANWLRALWRRVFPRVELQGVYEYVVAGPTVNWAHELRSVGSRHLPDVNSADFWTGAAGHRATLPTGMRVGVSFLDANPAKPIMVCTESAFNRSSGRNPIESEFYASDDVSVDAGTNVNLGNATANVVINNAAFSTWVAAVSAAAMVTAPVGYTSTKVKA